VNLNKLCDSVSSVRNFLISEGNKITMTDANENANTYEYDDLNRLINTTDADGDSIVYTYNADGTLTTKTDANGITCILEYDTYGQLIKKDFPGTEQDFYYEYDLNGNITKELGNNFDFTYQYDALNRLTSKTDNILSKTISYTYDAIGNRATMTDGESGLTEYTYDNLNRLTELKNPDNDITEYTYGKMNEKLSQTNANGTITENHYDTGYRLILLVNKKSNNDTILSFAYTYDTGGNILTKTNQDNYCETYHYDVLNQLIKVEYGDVNVVEYEYDAVGNRLKMSNITTADTEITEYFYNTDNQLLHYTTNDIDTVSFTYDANGNQLAKTTFGITTDYVYDYENRLLTISQGDTTISESTYGSDWKRLTKTTADSETKYLYDNDDVITEYDNLNNIIVRYTNDLSIDNIISSKRNSEIEYYHKDHLGSIINLTDNSQTITINYQYDAFGTIKNQSGTSPNEMTYTGRRFDNESGLYYYRTRYYNSVTGRFTQKDKYYYDLISDLNLNEEKIYNIYPLYVYVKNNSIVYSDPFGMFIEKEETDWFNSGSPFSRRKSGPHPVVGSSKHHMSTTWYIEVDYIQSLEKYVSWYLVIPCKDKIWLWTKTVPGEKVIKTTTLWAHAEHGPYVEF
jgi:RHS repeat-associated protein